MTGVLVDTAQGPARATTSMPGGTPGGTLVLGHGAGGLRWTDDVLRVRDTAVAAGWRVVLVDQPWRLALRRVGPAPAALDRAWSAVVQAVLAGAAEARLVPEAPLVLGGRSAGARVACRTAEALGADAVLALSFPLHPPGRPEKSRAHELVLPTASGIALHVVQGRSDPFGAPAEVAAVLGDAATVHAVPAAHSLESAADQVADLVRAWLPAVARRQRRGPAVGPPGEWSPRTAR